MPLLAKICTKASHAKKRTQSNLNDVGNRPTPLISSNDASNRQKVFTKFCKNFIVIKTFYKNW